MSAGVSIITDPQELGILHRAVAARAAGQEPMAEFDDLAAKARWRRLANETWAELGLGVQCLTN
jgi:hypothetical protein